jgi:organic radical activating enzyme
MNAYPMPTRLPWDDREVPHATIEVTQACNIQCKGCYKHKFNYHKPFASLKGEIDFIARQRNLETLTLLGGEPTLHPEIFDVVSYVKSKGIRPHILTNATTLSGELLAKLKAAGVARITMHIDSHQGKRPDFDTTHCTELDLNGLRAKYASLCHQHNIESGFAVTIYRDTLPEFESVVRCSEESNTTKVLATTYCQEANISEGESDSLSLTNEDVFVYLAQKGQYPSWFIGSDNNPNALRWLIYTTALSRNPKTGATSRYMFDPRHRLAMFLLPRLARFSMGRHRFESAPVMRERVVGLILMLILSLISVRPLGFFKILWFLFVAARNRDLVFHSIIIQELPRQLPDGRYDNCANCPDATVRNGKIIPVCYVDKVEPWKVPEAL